jgi:hypothetical protein
MKMTIENTDRFAELPSDADGTTTHARLWLGRTERGTNVKVYVVRVEALREDDVEELEDELRERPTATLGRLRPDEMAPG